MTEFEALMLTMRQAKEKITNARDIYIRSDIDYVVDPQCFDSIIKSIEELEKQFDTASKA